MTSNPADLPQGDLAAATDYDEEIDELAREGRVRTRSTSGSSLADIRDACDVLRPVYDESDGPTGS